MSIIKNIATSNWGPGPGKILKIYECSNFFDPLFGVWNFFNPPFWEFETFFDPPFWSFKTFFDPHQIFQPPQQDIYERSLIMYNVSLFLNMSKNRMNQLPSKWLMIILLVQVDSAVGWNNNYCKPLQY